MGDFEKHTYIVAPVGVNVPGVGLRARRVGRHGEGDFVGQEVMAFSPQEAIALYARGDLTHDEIVVPLSREAMLGFLGHGHPHSATWFAELRREFELATGAEATYPPPDDPPVFTATEVKQAIIAVVKGQGGPEPIMAHVRGEKEVSPESADAIRKIVVSAYLEMMVGE